MPSIHPTSDARFETVTTVFRVQPETQRQMVDVLVRISDEVAAPCDGFEEFPCTVDHVREAESG